MRRLIIRPGAIGDCIASLPAMESLKAGHTEIWVAAQNVPLMRFADCVRSIGSTGLDWLGIPDREAPRAVLEALAGFDEIVSWYGSNRPEFRDAVAGLPFRFLPALPDDAGVHTADFFLSQVGGRPPAVPRIECRRGRGGLIVIHPFSGSARKNWQLERFREVARRMGPCVRWCAGPDEPLDRAVRIENLYELACWLAENARVFLGNDSGIAHLAAAARVPVVALFGPTDPAVWAPRGPRVRVLARSRMEEIAVDEVLAAAAELIG